MEIEVDIGEVQSVAKVTACSGFDWDLYGNWFSLVLTPTIFGINWKVMTFSFWF